MFRELYKLVVLLSLCYTPLNAQTQELDDTTRYAVASLTSELVECSVFYSIMGAGQDSSGNLSANSERFLALTERLSIMALQLTKSVGMKIETLMSKAAIYSKEMGEEIGGDGINISILMNKHGDFCKTLVEDPEKRLEYWVLKEGS
tara:strand:+ start:31 stop:471 length:441 start_codon:yes stop_codon:yes gene_type:complete